MPYRCNTKCFTANRLYKVGEYVTELPTPESAPRFDEVPSIPGGAKVPKADAAHAERQKTKKKPSKKAEKPKAEVKKATPEIEALVKKAKDLGVNQATTAWSEVALEKNIAAAQAKLEKKAAAEEATE